MVEPQGFDSLAIAMAMRDIIRDMIRVEVDKLRPRYQMARVDSIDRINMTCMVTIIGDTTSTKVAMGSIQPLSEGQTVRIEGLQGDRFIADVMGAPYGGSIAMPEPGFRIQVGGTAPTSSTLEGFPLIWIKDSSTLAPVPVTPTVPSFDLAAFTVTAPTLTGVEYQIVDGVNYIPLVGGVATSVAGFTRPYVLTVRAVSTPGYALTSSYQWTRLLMDASNLVNWANDSFAGTAGAQLATGNNAAQRTWDMVGGGNASPTPVWYTNTGAGVAGGFQIASNGTSITKSTGSGVDASHVENFFNVGAANMEIDLVLLGFLKEHSETFTVFLGGTNSGGTSAVQPQLVYDSGAGFLIRFQGSGTVSGNVDYTWKSTSAVEADILGTFKFQWVNKFCQVTCPDSQVFGRDYSTSGVAYGNWGGLGVSNFNTRTRWATFDSIKVLR